MNADSPLDIKTYDGGNQGLHPSCLYFKDGWNGHRFWFVFTPYKNMNDAIENPCIYYSDDGDQFTAIQNANPLDNITLPKEQEYNSDPELVFNSDLNRIECWWRRVYTGLYPKEKERYTEILYRSYSYDGNDWSDKEVIFKYKNTVPATRGIISPALIYEDSKYKMWVSSSNDIDGRIRTIDYYEMKDGEKMTLISSHLLKGGTLSHIDVQKIEGKYYLIGNDAIIESNPLKLYSFTDPNGDYKFLGRALSKGQKGNWDDRVIYRPSILSVEDKIWLYYSAYQSRPSNHCHTGLIKFNLWKELTKQYLQF